MAKNIIFGEEARKSLQNGSEGYIRTQGQKRCT